MLIVHSHFHRRRTGITGHVDAIVRALAVTHDAFATGSHLSESTRRLSLAEVWRRSKTEDTLWHAHRNNELLMGLLMRAFRPRLKVVTTRHSTTPAGRYSRWLSARADARVALTSEVQRALGLPAISVAHGIDLRRFAPATDRAAAFTSFGLGGSFGVGVIGRVRPEKGQGDFAEAVAPLLSARPEWRGVLVGLCKPADAAFLRSSLERAGSSLCAVGEQPDVDRWYRGLTIVVHPSHREAYSLALLEALASGCCVVATRLPHHPELIDHGRTGFLYEPGDVSALRSLLSQLMADPARCAAIGVAAAEEARQRFGIEREAQALTALYASLR